ncbi:TlyA family RNA methyltransferase [Candidatus Saccharibacteria bacterium TM7i]|nr:TlyA family RNA methyltransferase [Candidatus Saccharibacteria bacterium TM7i]
MNKHRLDAELTARKLVATRSQAESWIKLGKVTVDGKVITKPGHFVREDAQIVLTAKEQYVSRAGLKLASVAKLLGVSFKDAVVLDVGSSTGGFTDYSLQNGAQKVYAVDVGTDQLHPSLQGNPKIELHEKTDIRDFIPPVTPDIIVIDVSFISLRDILPHLAKAAAGPNTKIMAMVKPQFEARREQASKGVIKNDAVRRKILQDFEFWAKDLFVIKDKRDSEVAGAKGNRERFYLLTLNRNSTTSSGRMM